jgi:peptide/nickel transport system permease protein
MINTNDPLEMVNMRFQPPSSKNILGTDGFGRDVLLEMAHGTRTSLTVGVISGLIATTVGLIIGIFSGYRGGIVDEILSSLTNVFIVIPSFIILILVSVSIQAKSVFIIAIIIGLTSWPWTARAVRAQTVSLRNRDHVNLARISGFNTVKIIVFEILPYIMSYVVMAFIIQLASGILSEASVSMLGLGPSNTISLGIMLNWALLQEAPLFNAWWTLIPPALTVALITFSFYLINLGMDEIFNPKIRS